jgi:hypothetical protein
MKIRILGPNVSKWGTLFAHNSRMSAHRVAIDHWPVVRKFETLFSERTGSFFRCYTQALASDAWKFDDEIENVSKCGALFVRHSEWHQFAVDHWPVVRNLKPYFQNVTGSSFATEGISWRWQESPHPRRIVRGPHFVDTL